MIQGFGQPTSLNGFSCTLGPLPIKELAASVPDLPV